MNTAAPRDEIWFRKIYFDVVRERRVTVVFRPGERSCGSAKGFCSGEILKLKFIDKVGADWAGVSGQTTPDFEQKVRVTESRSLEIGRLTAKDFEGSTPDVRDTFSLIYHLGSLYNLFPLELGDKAIVTRTSFTYL